MRLMILGAGKYGREIEDVATQTGGDTRGSTFWTINCRLAPRRRLVADFARFIDDNTAFFVAFGDKRYARALAESAV
jgi:hypothetical protein